MYSQDVLTATSSVTPREGECPINTVDENAARLVAFLAVVLAVLSLWQSAWWVIVLLAADFFVRAWVSRRYSPLRWVAKRSLRILGVSVKPVYAPPKQFAARIGSVLTLGALLLHVAGLHDVSMIVTGALIIAASLEAFLGFCIACWLYPYVFRLRAS